MAAKELFSLAREVRQMTRAAGCRFIVNDRVDIALATQADGVHLGQEDLPLEVARKLMGWEAGADAVAIISDLMGADDVAVKVRRILSLHRAS